MVFCRGKYGANDYFGGYLCGIYFAHTSAKGTKGEFMSIINKPPEMVKREYELQEPIASAVEKYACFIQSTPDHVVNSALKLVIWRDAEFRRWRKQHQNHPERKENSGSEKGTRA
jgi:hypothetical protein